MFVNLLPKESVGSIFRVLLLVGCLAPSTAKAGFDWTPPAAPVLQAAPIAQDAVSSGPLTPEPDALPVPVGQVETTPVQHTEPLVIDNKPASVPVAEKVEEKQVVETAPAPLPIPETAPASTPAPTTHSVPVSIAAPVADDVIDGFGKDIPLAIALRDIAPSKYAYSFSPRDVAGAKISWRGGKPWQDVLKDALKPLDLDVVISESTITIFAKEYKASENTTATQAPSAPPVPAEAPMMVAKRTDVVPASEETARSPEPSQNVQAQEVTTKTTSAEPRAATLSAMDMNAIRKWQARPGTTLRQTLEAWTKDSNVELNWSTPYDYPINNAFYFEGDFTQAVDSLLSSYGGENPSPKGRLYPNLPEGPSVLMVN